MFFISDAMAQAEGAGEPSLLATFLPLLLIFAVMYFLLIRPQIKRQKEHKKLVEAIEKGDEVATSGGLLGRVVNLGDTLLVLEIADGTNVVVQRFAVTTVMPKGTIKDAREA
ncbi:preprotein translocase subunit YajC [Guyparkeria sp. SCN-R1]|uniref:preprotein translocase subunit YajC n=1 Tax=unclassified Guyparkeria TaxID=2626246 RepID=UPI000F6475BE|nr:preprotein translocase subunit YajC [Guyparkeria sp. SCN-R1]RRQ23517.1 preprotein translocase subunit YajC [Guyparkeria sp. SCN-R1]